MSLAAGSKVITMDPQYHPPKSVEKSELLDVPAEIRTDRLILRPPAPGDGQIIYPAILETAEDLAMWMPWANPTPTSAEPSEIWARQAAAKFLTRSELHYLMHDAATGQFLGNVGFHDIRWQVPMLEIGYWLRKSAWGKGLMAEAVIAITSMAFNSLDAARVEIRCDDRNTRSGSVAQRCGFRLEGILRQDSRTPQGDLRDTRVYALLWYELI